MLYACFELLAFCTLDSLCTQDCLISVLISSSHSFSYSLPSRMYSPRQLFKSLFYSKFYLFYKISLWPRKYDLCFSEHLQQSGLICLDKNHMAGTLSVDGRYNSIWWTNKRKILLIQAENLSTNRSCSWHQHSTLFLCSSGHSINICEWKEKKTKKLIYLWSVEWKCTQTGDMSIVTCKIKNKVFWAGVVRMIY